MRNSTINILIKWMKEYFQDERGQSKFIHFIIFISSLGYRSHQYYECKVLHNNDVTFSKPSGFFALFLSTKYFTKLQAMFPPSHDRIRPLFFFQRVLSHEQKSILFKTKMCGNAPSLCILCEKMKSSIGTSISSTNGVFNSLLLYKL